MPSLYEIDKQMNELLDLYTQGFNKVVDGETGEILDIESMLKDVEKTRAEKIENTALYIKNQRVFLDALKAEKKKLESRIKATENAINGLCDYLKFSLNGEKVTNNTKFSIYYSSSTSAKINDLNLIPKEYLRYADPEPNKKAIQKAIKGGQHVPGAELVNKINIIIR